MKWLNAILIAYGLLNIAMGAQAFFFPHDKPSIISLAAGSGAGFAILAAVWLTTKSQKGGYLMALAVCGILLLHFARSLVSDFTQSKPIHFYPKPFSIVVALGVAGALGAGHLMALKGSKPASPEQG